MVVGTPECLVPVKPWLQAIFDDSSGRFNGYNARQPSGLGQSVSPIPRFDVRTHLSEQCIHIHSPLLVWRLLGIHFFVLSYLLGWTDTSDTSGVKSVRKPELCCCAPAPAPAPAQLHSPHRNRFCPWLLVSRRSPPSPSDLASEAVRGQAGHIYQHPETHISFT